MPSKISLAGRESQMDLAFAVVPYVALAVSLILSLATESPLTGRYVAWTVGLTAVAAVWLTLMRVKIADREGIRPRSSSSTSATWR